jgi:cell division protein FtsI (penicillin-binding protein 3)
MTPARGAAAGRPTAKRSSATSTGKQSTRQPARQPAKRAAPKQTAKQPAKRTGTSAPVRQGTRQGTRQTAKQPAAKQPAAKQPAKRATKQAAKQPAKRPAKQAAKRAPAKRAVPAQGTRRAPQARTTRVRSAPPPPPRSWLPAPRVGNPDRRLKVALLLALFVLSLFGGRLVQLQGLDASVLAAKALDQRSRKVVLTAHRGDILDAKGAVLATTVDRRTIVVDQTLVPLFRSRSTDDETPDSGKGIQAAARALAPLLHLGVPEVEAKLTGTKRYEVVAKDVEPDVWRQVARLDIPGIAGEQTSRRVYPSGSVGASLVGFVGRDGTPLAGVERTRQSELAGVNGEMRFEQSADGRAIPTGLSSEVEPRPGKNVQLTIDRYLQWKTQETLSAAVRKTAAESGYAVALDPRSGDVLALASVPTFDANSPGDAPVADRENRALVDVFEPGSTSKVITAAAALEERAVTPASRFLVRDEIRRGGKTFHDSHSHEPEKLTFAGVLAQSSNVGTLLAGERVPPKDMYGYLRGFGLGSPTGIGLPESRGILAEVEDWNRSQRYTVLFGQGLSVTALQAAGVYATIANDGVRVAPRLVKAVGDGSGGMTPARASASTRVVSAGTAQQLRLMLESVVGDEGTAAAATIPGYRVAGKTGTAQAYDDKCGCYRGYTASFIGMAPADDPQVVVAVFLQKPKRGHYGGVVAAPVFQQVMTYALAARGIPPSGTKPPKVPLGYR